MIPDVFTLVAPDLAYQALQANHKSKKTLALVPFHSNFTLHTHAHARACTHTHTRTHTHTHTHTYTHTHTHTHLETTCSIDLCHHCPFSQPLFWKSVVTRPVYQCCVQSLLIIGWKVFCGEDLEATGGLLFYLRKVNLKAVQYSGISFFVQNFVWKNYPLLLVESTSNFAWSLFWRNFSSEWFILAKIFPLQRFSLNCCSFGRVQLDVFPSKWWKKKPAIVFGMLKSLGIDHQVLMDAYVLV